MGFAADPAEYAHHGRAAAAVVLAGSFLVLLDTTIVNVALASIAADLDVDDGIEWVVTAQFLAIGVAQAPTGWLADRFGLRPVFLVGVGGFVALALAAASATNLPLLIAARSGQGVCGGAVLVVATLLLYEMAPADARGRMVGYAGAMAMLAPALGPVLSGWVVGSTSWRWLLAGFGPAGAVLVVLGIHLVPPIRTGESRPMDWLGTVLLTAALVAILIACTQAGQWGLVSGSFLALMALGVLLGAALFARLRAAAHPVIGLALYRSRDFSICMAIIATLAMAQFARNVFIPLEMQAIRGLSPLEAGAVLTPGALVAAVAMGVVGRVTDRVGPKRPIIVGLVATAVAMAMLSRTDEATPVAAIASFVAISSVGTVMVSMPATLLSLSSISRRMRTQGAAARTLTRQVAGALGTAILAAVIVNDVGQLTAFEGSVEVLSQAQEAYNRGFVVATTLVVVGIALALGLSAEPVDAGDEGGIVEGDS